MTSQSILVIDMGGTNAKFGAIHQGQHLSNTKQVATKELRSGDPVLNLARLIGQIAKELGIKPDAVVSSVPGFLDPDRDLVRFAGNIPELNGRRLATELRELTGIPVILERDAIISLRGEWRAGAGKGVKNLLGLFFGTGVGGAFLQEGIAFRGGGFSLEIGNMPFKGEGRELSGMRTDCLEAYVSGRVLRDIAERYTVPIQEVFLSLDLKKGLGAEMNDFINNQAIAIGIAFSLFSPDRVVLGGGICEMPGFPVAHLSKLVAANSTVREMGVELDLRPASLGWEAVLHGAELIVT
ncbi:MAG: ROK family protein, partial [Trueperaceae bacterium]|nr:ROK family protein [Trueperaceae bacterium]